MKKPQTQTKKIIEAALSRNGKPFRSTELTIPGVGSNTVTSVLATLLRAHVLHAEPIIGQKKGRAFLYTLQRGVTLDHALQQVSRVRARYNAQHRRQQRRRRRAAPHRRAVPADGLMTLHALRESATKAVLYDRLIAYFHLDAAEVAAALRAK